MGENVIITDHEVTGHEIASYLVLDGVAKGQGLDSNVLHPSIKLAGVHVAEHPRGLVIVILFAEEMIQKMRRDLESPRPMQRTRSR